MNEIVSVVPKLRMRLIGPLGLWTARGEDLSPVTPRARMLLAGIALCAPRPALKVQLTRVIWPDLDAFSVRTTIRREIRRMLDALGPDRADIIAVSHERLWFRPGCISLDIDDVMRASAENPESLALLDRDLLEDLKGIEPAFDAWVNGWRDRLRGHARTVADQLLASRLAPADTIPAARRVLAIDPSHEAAWRALMLAQVELGQRDRALTTYEHCRDTFAEYLGLAPSVETQALLPRLVPEPKPAERPAVRPPVPARPRPDETLLEIMPLTSIGQRAGEDDLGHAVAEELARALSRFRWMTVLGPVDPKFAASEAITIGPRADIRLQGTIQRHCAGVRVSLRLLDVQASDQIIWAGRFDQPAGGQEWRRELVAAAVGQIMTRAALFDRKLNQCGADEDQTAEVLTRRAVVLLPSMTREKFMRAGELLSRAVALDPDHVVAKALCAAWHVMLVNQGWHAAPKQALEKAAELAGQALRRGAGDPLVLSLVAHVLARQPIDLAEAEALHARAMRINPLAPIGWGMAALTAAYGGDADEASRRFRRYKSLSPHDPFARTMDVAAPMIHMLRRDHVAAAAAGRATVQIRPFSAQNYRGYLSALGYLGQRREAETVRERLMTLAPRFSIDTFLATTPIRDSAGREHYVKGLRLAGVE